MVSKIMQALVRWMSALILLGAASLAVLPSAGAEELSNEDLAKLAQNPIANLISVPFQNNTNFNYGPDRGVQDVLNIEPVIPITLTQEWNLITRTILPVIFTVASAVSVTCRSRASCRHPRQANGSGAWARSSNCPRTRAPPWATTISALDRQASYST